ncbi:chromate efflux transporter [Gayadomonas joobiniege]|uniref:chromate efflux transporter n=1 Tax=Gayadomonas joobiniege TaxID=1234606 RepID=UPI00035CCA40|nr:chromate efflux transporter [Gayadomonas joobiniege]
MPKLSDICSLFMQFFKLGLIAFGGPAAHLGLFKKTFVDEKKWLTDSEFAQIMAICQFMPGPASSQVGISIGIKRAGQLGGFIAWLAFTLPTAILLVLTAYGLLSLTDDNLAGAISGLKLAAAAIVLHATVTMFNSFCNSWLNRILAVVAMLLMLSLSFWWTQFIIIIAAGLISSRFSSQNNQQMQASQAIKLPISRGQSIVSIVLLISLLFLLPFAAAQTDLNQVDMFSRFFRIGASVFGGGHVVLPLLQQDIVAAGWVNNENFLAGYGITQAMPGPIFSFSAFLGAVNEIGIHPVLAAVICLVAIFAPSFLLINGVFYSWHKIGHNRHLKRALSGINAAVVGLLAAALWDPVLSSSVTNLFQLVVFIGLSLLVFSRLVPVWLVVIGAGCCGYFWQ